MASVPLVSAKAVANAESEPQKSSSADPNRLGSRVGSTTSLQ